MARAAAPMLSGLRVATRTTRKRSDCVGTRKRRLFYDRRAGSAVWSQGAGRISAKRIYRTTMSVAGCKFSPHPYWDGACGSLYAN